MARLAPLTKSGSWDVANESGHTAEGLARRPGMDGDPTAVPLPTPTAGVLLEIKESKGSLGEDLNLCCRV